MPPGNRMRFTSLGSGSRGNATLVAHQDDFLLVDLGFSLRNTEYRLGQLGVSPRQIKALLVSHEHGDHVRGVQAFARKFSVPVYMTPGTRDACSFDDTVDVQLIRHDRSFTIGTFGVQPVAVPHDAREPTQFIVKAAGRSLGILTDLGHISAHVRRHYAACDALMLECNHDLGLLKAGSYPETVKRRIGGDLGHLNNQQAAELLKACDLHRLKQLVLCHISEQSNRPELALREVRPYLDDFDGHLHCARQEPEFNWLEVG